LALGNCHTTKEMCAHLGLWIPVEQQKNIQPLGMGKSRVTNVHVIALV